ncbi:MAG TPA: phosphoenolpyruvate--protein phosphotransferase [Puia sp.]|jgi:phosphotransferase system enzyme I (PtsI)|nr:phosphoenolpyruvate--protein phosphotransferase [Puia sp.]
MKGIGVSPGISIGKAYVLRQRKEVASGVVLTDESAVLQEIGRYGEAVKLSVKEVQELFEKVVKEERDILEVQLELLQDPQLETDVRTRISSDKMTARDAVLMVIGLAVQVFEQMEDEYLKARAADVRDAGNRIVRNLSDGTGRNLSGSAGSLISNSGEGLIIIAEDLSPSETIGMDRSKVVGFATQSGGKTSHVAIVARLRGLPAVVGCGGELDGIVDGDRVVLDGNQGLVLVNPDASIVDEYRKKREIFIQEVRRLETLKDQPAVTTDGVKIELLANIATAEDMEQALAFGAEGVGLFRTELLFMERDSFPTEDEQVEYYKTILLQAGNRIVTIRTLDIGGDKPLPYLELPEEDNPFLGYRAIRICLDRKDIFLTQLKAILRASVFGKCRIMLPMISGVREVQQARAILEEAKEELFRSGIAFDTSIKMGIMIEVPSAAVIADLLAKEVDFFSIGTNDLCQYVLAADRMNKQIKDLYDPYHPAVLRLIRFVIEQGHLQGIPVGMCGELAGDPQATSLLLGMGLTEFSMNAPAIPTIKDILIQSSEAAARKNFQL